MKTERISIFQIPAWSKLGRKNPAFLAATCDCPKTAKSWTARLQREADAAGNGVVVIFGSFSPVDGRDWLQRDEHGRTVHVIASHPL